MTTDVRLLKLPEVLALTRKSRTSVLVAVRKGEFPQPVNIGDRAVAWVASEVQGWVDQRLQARCGSEQQGGAHA